MKQAASLAAQTSTAARQPQQQQQRDAFAHTSVAPLRNNDAFAATTRAPLSPAAARSLKPKASDLRSSAALSAAAAASLSSTLPRPSSDASSPDYLTASFKIGSINGRMNFASEERVFHRSDVPLKARDAKEQITQILKTNLLDPQAKNWDDGTTSGVAIRGSKHCSWETDLDRFDDRFFHQLESEQRVQRAHQRIETIRAGMDPDFDGRNISRDGTCHRSGGASRQLLLRSCLCFSAHATILLRVVAHDWLRIDTCPD